MRIKSLIAVTLMGLPGTTLAAKETTSLKDLQPAVGVSSMEAPSSRPAVVYGQIRMETMQYFTPIPEQPQLTYSQFLSARLSGLKETSWVDVAADISGGTFFARGQSHYIVHEAYLASPGRTPFKAYVGRKKKDWSELDRRWSMGMWQPTFAIDALRPEEQGLAGLFLDYNTRRFEFLAFATPIFIPNMGPDIREQGGALSSQSRWFRSPSRNYAFNDKVNTIQYSLDIPEVEKLVMNGAVGAMTRVGDKGDGPWMVVSGGYLPVNELILKRQNYKVADQDQVDVTVSPDVTYHSLYSADVGYSFYNLKATLSYLRDAPVEKRPEVDWAIQKILPLQAYAAALDFSLSDVFSKTLAFQVEYLKVEGGEVVDILNDGTPDDFTLFDQRVKFTNALSFKVEGQLATFWRRPFVTRFKYLYDYDQQGSILNTELLYYPSARWAMLVGGDVLGVQDEKDTSSRFINQYRANDRVYGGMTYVF